MRQSEFTKRLNSGLYDSKQRIKMPESGSPEIPATKKSVFDQGNAFDSDGEENEYVQKAENCLDAAKEKIEDNYEILKDRAMDECESSTKPEKLEETGNLVLAIALNLIIMLSVKEIGVLPHFFFLAYIPLSLMVTYIFLSNKKVFEVYDFEDLYFTLNHMSSQSRSVVLTQQKENNPRKYYEKILKFFKGKYPSISFKLKTRKRHDSEHYLNTRSIFQNTQKLLKKGLKLSFKDDEKKFLSVNEEEYLRLLQAEQWELSKIKFNYFQFLNPAIIMILFFGGFTAVFANLMIVFLISQLKDKFQASHNGENFVKANLQRIESKHLRLAQQNARQKNGDVVMRYIDRLKKQAHLPVRSGGVSSAAPRPVPKAKKF